VSVGEDVVKFAADAGLFLDPWQQDVLVGSMGLRMSKTWAARHVGLLVPRQNGKGSILEARELYGLFASDEKLIIHSAHKYDTSQKHFARLMTLIESNPDLDRHIKRLLKSPGKELIELTDGTTLQFKARTVSGTARGFTGDLIVLDEAMYLPEEAVDAMLPTSSAVPNPQTWVTSSAGNVASGFLWRVVQRGRGGHPTMAYFEWGTPRGADVADRQVWADANPGLGIRVSEEALEDDFDLMTPEGFAREHLGVWDDPAADSLIDPSVWAELATDVTVRPAVFGVCGSLDGAIAIVGVGADDNGLPVLDLVHHRAGTRGVVDLCRRLDKEHQPSAWVLDEASPVFWMAKDLQAAGLYLHLLKAAEVSAAAAQLVDAVTEGTVWHGPGFDDAVRGVRERGFRDGGFFFGRRASDVDISPLTAAAPGLWAWTVYGEGLGVDDVTIAF
jgi:hypothetical protein